MLAGRTTKENSDTIRHTVSLADWLDDGETISTIVDETASVGVSGWSASPFPVTPPYDPTPLEIQSTAIITANTAVRLFLAGGTPGNVYTVRFVVVGTSGRYETIEVQVQISGQAPVAPPVVPPPIELDALSIEGGTLEGPLYLFEDPQTPGEAVTKRYSDALWDGLNTQLTDEAASRVSADTTLQTNLNTEIARAEAAEAVLTAGLAAEITRAEAAEGVLTTHLATEVTRAEAAEAVLTAGLAAEISRAEDAETTLQDNIDAEASARAAAIASEAASRTAGDATNAAAVVTERTRALAAEAALAAALAAETTRAEAAEAALSALIGASPTFKSGFDSALSGGHTRITFPAAFATACDGFSLTPVGSGLSSICIVGNSDRFGIDVWAVRASGTAAPAGMSISWIAFGH